VTRLTFERFGIPILAGARDCTSKRQRWLWRLPGALFNGYRGSFPGLKRPGREVAHCPPSSAEVKSEWNLISPHPVCFPGVYRDTFNVQGYCNYMLVLTSMYRLRHTENNASVLTIERNACTSKDPRHFCTLQSNERRLFSHKRAPTTRIVK
jgi:hypothetical protein